MPKTKKILFSGGGTLGSVSPLLAIYDVLKEEKIYSFLWVGTSSGPEKNVIKKEGIKFIEMKGGKLRRYFSLLNFFDIFKIISDFFKSVSLIKKEKPDLIISAGSFVSVPLVWAAFLFRVNILIHQLDFRPGLANKLMAPFAKKITVSFKKSLKDYGKKAYFTGIPLRRNFLNNYQKENLKEELNLNINLPLVLVVGGGTGAEKINEMIFEIAPTLIKKTNIIHVCGKNKIKKVSRELEENYHQYEFLNPNLMAEYLKKADLVISRAGLGFLSELAYLKKASIIIPLPNSHQEDNVQVLIERQAALVFYEKNLSTFILSQEIEELLNNKEKRMRLGENIKESIKSGEDSVSDIIKIIKEII